MDKNIFFKKDKRKDFSKNYKMDKNIFFKKDKRKVF
jgi:hypothetical protein